LFKKLTCNSEFFLSVISNIQSLNINIRDNISNGLADLIYVQQNLKYLSLQLFLVWWFTRSFVIIINKTLYIVIANLLIYHLIFIIQDSLRLFPLQSIHLKNFDLRIKMWNQNSFLKNWNLSCFYKLGRSHTTKTWLLLI